ncbi:hypothetical protein [Chromobacterium aquaticum]|uniref:Integrase n=1 Tax=Chromobacterium aquaticum TaxID=467180 RepID=A0ABV8ZQR8_9NEIS|nr:hypothetical protein [Chromobacterium aquaticum]MCD5361263.1 hypothetical protein [Chromobacterium aquaticum]
MKRIKKEFISQENVEILKQIVAWWLYGPAAVHNPITLRQRFYTIRPLFRLASSHGIHVSDLVRFPAVVDEFIGNMSSGVMQDALALLHGLCGQRDMLGFTLLDFETLRRIEAALPEHESRQTPYVPPRIWLYQVNRLRDFLDDFHLHRERIESCYHYCLDAYAKNYGSLAEACKVGQGAENNPFWSSGKGASSITGKKYHGRFISIAKRFGIDDLLRKWLVMPGEEFDKNKFSVKSMSTYFSMVGYVGMAYLLNFSLMRISEGWALRSNCLIIENDERLGSFYMLRGKTNKTIVDDDARWVTSPSAKVAIDAMACVAKLRIICAEANPDVPTTDEDVFNPYLILRPYEPWGTTGADEMHQPLTVRPSPLTYLQVYSEGYPVLFNVEELRITQEDFQIARLINPTLNAEKFAVGHIWPLAWHQLRRTGAVNMQASGLVSDASLQYQLKHSTRAMSLYYGQGYSRVNLNDKARIMYIRTMYEMLGKEISRLFSERYVSPHGDKRKAEILRLVNPKENQKLSELAKLGKISWRETLLGGCTKKGPCPYGGIDNVVHCSGGDGSPACPDVLYDRDKINEINLLRQVIRSRLVGAQEGSPRRASLEAQLCAVENVLNVIEIN